MFERFTAPARQVVTLAQDEARALGHNYIGTEHILLGLLREEEGLAARALASLGITAEEVRAQVGRIVGGRDEVTTGQIPFTPRAKKVLEVALRESLSLGHDYIGTEHLLLAVARGNDGVAARILDDLGAAPENVFAEVGRVLSKPISADALRSSRPGRVSIQVGSVSPWSRLAGLGLGWLFAIAAGGVGLGILVGWAIWGH